MIHRHFTEVAKDYGVIASLLFYHIGYWVNRNKKEGRNLHASRYWIYTTVHDLSHNTFYYLTENQIRYALEKLRATGLIETGNWNKNSYDRTLWYTLTEKGQDFWDYCIKELENNRL